MRRCRLTAANTNSSGPARGLIARTIRTWVEQKNGAMVRRLAGYGRLSGLTATANLGRLYQSARLYVNFFQPSFKLASKQREGSLVRRRYHPPLTPCQRLLASPYVDEVVKDQLRQRFAALDPVALLKAIRDMQQELAAVAMATASRRHGLLTTSARFSMA